MSRALIRKIKKLTSQKIHLKNVAKNTIVSWYCDDCEGTHVGKVIGDNTIYNTRAVETNRHDETGIKMGEKIHIDTSTIVMEYKQ